MASWPVLPVEIHYTPKEHSRVTKDITAITCIKKHGNQCLMHRLRFKCPKSMAVLITHLLQLISFQLRLNY